MTDTPCTPQDVLTFWFETITPAHWYKPPAGLDEECRRRFAPTHLQLSRNVDAEWRSSPDARLATAIVLDQLPRNIYRGSPLAFATDGLARREARAAIAAGADLAVEPVRRAFFYLPFEHSEAIEDQEEAVRLFTVLGDAELLDYAVRHRDIVARFGRFPHRNAIVGRASTAKEVSFLTEPGSSF